MHEKFMEQVLTAYDRHTKADLDDINDEIRDVCVRGSEADAACSVDFR